MDPHFFLVLIAAIVVGALCKYREINPALPLIGIGFVLDIFIPTTAEQLAHPEAVLTLILAPLIFAAGLASSALDLRQIRRSVLLLAVGLVVITTAAVGFATTLMLGVPIAAACAFAAALAPTDAVAASSVAKRTGLPRRVVLVIEGESLANDGTALTLLRVAVVAASATVLTPLGAGVIFVQAVGFGILIGIAGGWFTSSLMRFSREAVVSNSILLLAPFALYELSEHLGGSGLLTLVIAGVWISHATGIGPAYQARLQATSIWSLITFLLESVAFVLVGVEFFGIAAKVTEPSYWTIALLALGIMAALLVVRGAFVAIWFILGPKFRPDAFADKRTKGKEFIAIGLLGVRGPISVLAALSLPEDFPQRNLLLTLTFLVVIYSLLGGMFASPIIRRLNLSAENEEEALKYARLATAKSALRRLDQLVIDAELDGAPMPDKAVQRVRNLAARRVEALKGLQQREAGSGVGDTMKLTRRLQREMLQAEREEIARLRVERRVPGDIIAKLTHELDVREAALGQPGPRL